MAVLAHIKPAVLNGWIMLAGSLTGGTAIYAMTRVYRLRTVPSWNHAGTPLHFLGTALLLGGLLCTLVLKMYPILPAVGQDEYRNVSIIAVLAGVVLKMLAAGVSPSGAIPLGPFGTLQPVFHGSGVVLWVGYILSGGSIAFQSVLLMFAAVSLVTGEIIHRIRFYDAYQRVGL